MNGAGAKHPKSRAGPLRCYTCNEEGHVARNCPKKPQQRCYNCGKPGHMKRECPEAISSSQRAHKSPDGGQGRAASLLVDVKPAAVERKREDGTARHVSHKNGRNTPPNTASGMPRPLPGVKASSRDLKSATFIDTHCHLEYVFERFKHQGSFASFMAEQKYPANYEGCITTFCDPTAFSPSFGIWRSLLSEENVWGTFGVHPHNAKYYRSSSLEEKMLKCVEHPKCVALGEIGLDYADHSPSDPETQKCVLTRQLELAVTLRKPIILHCRDAEEDLFELLSSTVPRDWKLHLHCFTGPPGMARRFLQTFSNLYIGICGNVTYDHSTVQRLVAEVPMDRLLLETDAPYNVPRNLPKHLRGRFSHPAMAFYIAKEIAQRRHMNIADVLRASRENTRAMYSI